MLGACNAPDNKPVVETKIYEFSSTVVVNALTEKVMDFQNISRDYGPRIRCTPQTPENMRNISSKAAV